MQAYNVKMSKHRKLAVAGVIIGALLFTTSTLLPTKKELAVIVGGGMTYQLLTSDTAKEVGGYTTEEMREKFKSVLALS